MCLEWRQRQTYPWTSSCKFSWPVSQWYSSNKEDGRKVARNNTYDQDYHMKVEISCFGGDLGVEDFLDWLVEFDWFYKHTRVSYSRMIKTIGFTLKHGTLI
jgi:hypothetical protein